MLLSERVRPDCEVAPWVIPEIKQLEAEVERLSSILAALREPSEAVFQAAAAEYSSDPDEHHETITAKMLRAAVAAAEEEVR